MKSPRIYAAHSIQTSYFTPNTLCRAYNLMSLHTYKVQNHNASTSKTCHFDTYPNLREILLKYLKQSISSPLTTYNTWNNPPYRAPTPLKHHILYLKHANIRSKFYHSMPLHTNTANFAPSSNLQEILLAYKLNSNNPPFAHLFVLIIFEPISHIYATQTSYFIPNTQRKVYHTMPLNTYTANFTTSSTLQEILSNSPFIQHFLLIICEITM